MRMTHYVFRQILLFAENNFPNEVGGALGAKDDVVFISFSVICMFFAYKSCKGRLVSSLSFLPPPAVILASILLAEVIGLFTAPYHIAKWVAKKINAELKSLSDDDDDE